MNTPIQLEDKNREPVSRTMRATLMRFPAPVWVIFAGTFINRFGTFVVPFLALHLVRLGYSVKSAGVAVAAYGVGHFVASIVGGHLADSIGRRNTILLSMFSSGVALIAMSQATSLPMILTLAFAAGVTAEIYRPASSALLIDLVDEEDRVTAFAAYRFAINAGWAFGPATAGVLAKYSYTWLFVGDAATSVVFGLLAWRFLPQLRIGRRDDWKNIGAAIGSLRETAKLAFADPRFRQMLLSTFLVALVYMQMPSTFGVDMKARGFSEEIYGAVLALNGVLVVLFEIPITAVTRRCSPRGVMALGYVMIGAGFGYLAWAGSLASFVIAMTIFTFGEMVSMPVALARISSLAPASHRGRYMGLYGLTWASALALGPGFGMQMYAWSPAGMWLCCGASAAIGAAMVFRPTFVSASTQTASAK
jgi:MFS family permease